MRRLVGGGLVQRCRSQGRSWGRRGWSRRGIGRGRHRTTGGISQRCSAVAGDLSHNPGRRCPGTDVGTRRETGCSCGGRAGTGANPRQLVAGRGDGGIPPGANGAGARLDELPPPSRFRRDRGLSRHRDRGALGPVVVQCLNTSLIRRLVGRDRRGPDGSDGRLSGVPRARGRRRHGRESHGCLCPVRPVGQRQRQPRFGHPDRSDRLPGRGNAARGRGFLREGLGLSRDWRRAGPRIFFGPDGTGRIRNPGRPGDGARCRRGRRCNRAPG